MLTYKSRNNEAAARLHPAEQKLLQRYSVPLLYYCYYYYAPLLQSGTSTPLVSLNEFGLLGKVGLGRLLLAFAADC